MTVQSLGVKALFDRALEIESLQERQAYLEQACAGDAVLRNKVETLLKAYDDAGSFLEPPAAHFSATVNMPTVQEAPGAVIGHYKLLQQVGEGGFGVVYMAEQQEPVRRKVALKVVKPGMDSGQVIARFEAERQALAMMDHQNIARVLDAGTTDTGRPYFVMELVKGVAITEYCDKNTLTPRERMELFVPVCQALQHAHQKGIIHRDIKPSNVLVCLYDGKPVPKVIDFGVAKAIEQRLTEKTMFTQHGQVIGTLEYMSPEQAEMSQLDIDTRSDVYSLGVLLYELLTGSTPITKKQLHTAGFIELLRMIREAEPEKPSTRLSHSADALPTISARRHTEPAKLGPLLRGELDWIVMKSLEKDRTRRYETANDLARDIERYLHDEPVEAGPPSVVYRARKFVRRNRLAVFIALFVPAALVAIVLNLYIGNVRLGEARTRADAEALRAKEAEALALDRLDETTRQKQRSERAEARTSQERDRAVAAEHETRRQRALEVAAREQTQDLLARSLFNQAIALRISGKLGGRWQALQLLQEAKRLCSRKRQVEPNPPDAGAAVATRLPTSAELHSEAVAALLLNDAREVWSFQTPVGMQPGVSGDGRRGIVTELSPDQKGLVMRYIDLTDGHELDRWDGEPAAKMFGTGLSLSPDGKLLASCGVVGTGDIAVWDLSQKRRVRVLEWPRELGLDGQPEAPPRFLLTSLDMGFSPDGRHLAAMRRNQVVGTPDKDREAATIAVWSVEAGGEPRILHVMGGISEAALSWFAFSSDGTRLAYRTGEKQVTVWSLERDEQVVAIELPEVVLGRGAFDAKDQRLAVSCGVFGSKQGHVVIWDLAENKERRRLPMDRLLYLSQPAFSPNGGELAIGDAQGGITILNLLENSETLYLDRAHQGMTAFVRWGPDDRHLLSFGLEGSLKRWELSGGRPASQISTIPHSAFSFAFSSDGNWLAVSSGPANVVQLISRPTGRAERELSANGFPAYEVMFSNDSRQVAQFGGAQAVIWEVGTGREVARLDVKNEIDGQIVSAAFTREGKLIASTTNQQTKKIAVWDVAAGREIWQAPEVAGSAFGILGGEGRLLGAVPFLPSGRKNEQITVWELPAGRESTRLDLGGEAGGFPQFSPDGRWLVGLDVWNGFAGVGFGRMGGRSGLTVKAQVVVQSVASDAQKFKIPGSSAPDAYAFSPDSRLLAIGYRDGSVQLWEIERGEELYHYASGAKSVAYLAFTHDGGALASSDGTSPQIQLLHVSDLRHRLAEMGLDRRDR
ncbi:MAG TPA: protein kinase [Planctomycetaceae bacterium]|jgi:serine/threonine protein kinase/WD40 repeat protein